MSMNLYCSALRLWQTPTAISRKCLTVGEVFYFDADTNELKHKALVRYVKWIATFIHKPSQNGGTQKDWEKQVKGHIKQVIKLLQKDLTHVEIYMM